MTLLPQRRIADRMGGQDGQAGFVLVAVLWMVALLAGVALVLSRQVRQELAITRTAVGAMQAEALADGGVMLAVRHLHSFRGTQNAGAGVSEFDCILPDGGRLIVMIADENGKVDLNTGSEEIITALLAGAGASEEQAHDLAQRLLDYRDPDSDRRRNGAEREEYEKIGRKGPANRALNSVGELHHVLGFEPDVVARLSPHVTVHSGQTGVDPGLASRLLLMLLAGGIDRKQDAAMKGMPHRDDFRLPQSFRSLSSRQAYTIIVSAVTANGGRFVRRTTVSLLPVRGPRARSKDLSLEQPDYRHFDPLPVKFWSWEAASAGEYESRQTSGDADRNIIAQLCE